MTDVAIIGARVSGFNLRPAVNSGWVSGAGVGEVSGFGRTGSETLCTWYLRAALES